MTPHPLPSLSLLALLLLGSACPPSTPTTQPAADEPPSAPEVLEWLLGDQVRGGEPAEPGSSVGIIAIPMGILTKDEAPLRVLRTQGTVQAGSCAPDLVQLLPIRGRPGTHFGINESGELLRRTDDGWSAVPSAKDPIDKLIASSNASEGLQLLVALRDHPHELHLLVLFDDEVTDTISVDLRTMQDRHGALKRFDSGRCIEDHDCLHPVSIDDEVILMLEPQLYDNHVPTDIDLGEGVRDVRYADEAGTMLDVLTIAACPSAEPTADPSTEPETAP